MVSSSSPSRSPFATLGGVFGSHSALLDVLFSGVDALFGGVDGGPGGVASGVDGLFGLLLGSFGDFLGLLDASDRGPLGVALGAEERVDGLSDELLLVLARIVEGVDELRLEVVPRVVLGALEVVELAVDRRAELAVECGADGIELGAEELLERLGALLLGGALGVDAVVQDVPDGVVLGWRLCSTSSWPRLIDHVTRSSGRPSGSASRSLRSGSSVRISRARCGRPTGFECRRPSARQPSPQRSPRS